VVHGIEESSVNSEDSHDDTDVLSSAVIEDAVGIAVAGADNQAFSCIVQARKDSEHGGLVAADESENVWAFNNRQKWCEEPPMVEDDD
jgi:hypothetical protein